MSDSTAAFASVAWARAWLLEALGYARWTVRAHTTAPSPAEWPVDAGHAVETADGTWLLYGAGPRPCAVVLIGADASPDAEHDELVVVRVLGPGRVRLESSAGTGPTRPGLPSAQAIAEQCHGHRLATRLGLPAAAMDVVQKWRGSHGERASVVPTCVLRAKVAVAAVAAQQRAGGRVLVVVPRESVAERIAPMLAEFGVTQPCRDPAGMSQESLSAPVLVTTVAAAAAWLAGPAVMPVPADEFAAVLGVGVDTRPGSAWARLAGVVDARAWAVTGHLPGASSKTLPGGVSGRDAQEAGVMVGVHALAPWGPSAAVSVPQSAAAIAAGLQDLAQRAGRPDLPKTVVLAGRRTRPLARELGRLLGDDVVAAVGGSPDVDPQLRAFATGARGRVLVMSQVPACLPDLAVCEVLVTAVPQRAEALAWAVDACAATPPSWVHRDALPGVAPKRVLLLASCEPVRLPATAVADAWDQVAGPCAAEPVVAAERGPARVVDAPFHPASEAQARESWLDALDRHAARPVRPDDLSLEPFAGMGGLPAALALFGDRLPLVLADPRAALQEPDERAGAAS